MRHSIVFLLVCSSICTCTVIRAQRADIENFQSLLPKAQTDSLRWYYNIQLSALYMRINFDSSNMYGERSLQLGRAIQLPSAIARSLNTLGAANWSKGDHETALKYYFDALNIAQQYKLPELASTILSNIGLVYSDRKEFDLALSYLRKAETAKIETKDTVGLLRALNNIGKVFNETNQTDSALYYYNRCLPYFDRLPAQKQGKGIVLNNLGSIYLSKADFEHARNCFDESLKIRQEIGDKGGMGVVYNNLGQLATQEGQFDAAIRYLEQALALSGETGSLTDRTDVWIKLSNAYFHQKNYEKAYEYLQKYTLRQDTLYRQESAASIANMEVKYQTAQKEAAIRQLESDNRLKNLLNYGALAGILALLIVLWLSRRTYRQRRQLQQATIDRLESERKVVALNAHLEGQQRERLRIAEDLHDDFGSGLSKISLLSELVKKKSPAPELDKISAAARELLLKMSEIVWALNFRNDTLASLATYIRRYTAGYFEDTDVRCIFQIQDDLPELPLGGEVRRNVFLVVKESLHNILKHANATRVEIFITTAAGQLEIKITDNGKGFDTTAISGAGNGLRNMARRMEAEQGAYFIESTPGSGTITRLALPLNMNEASSSAQAA